VARATERKFLGFTFWVGSEGEVKRRVSPQALDRMRDRVRKMTRLTVGRSLAQVCESLREYLVGWKGYFQIAQIPRVFVDLDKWIRHRLRALQLKQWRRPYTISCELRARGESVYVASRVAAHAGRWWRCSATMINYALPNKLFDGLGLPRLAA
jgi:RNA-directed DNA polymerase